ncbi:MAG TPA: GntR family transcriptional regulator [Anaerolineaceae bacterium]|nr:GntR family transcriptional regulator [Anaerolineaceae bacterium]
MVTLDLRLDFRSEVPITTQIVEQIQDRVLNGELQPNDQLPTVRQLAADLRVNFNTVARAYRLLDEAGLISTQHGRGTYVLEAPVDGQSQRLRHEALGHLTRDYLKAADRLGLSPAEVRTEFESQWLRWSAQQREPEPIDREENS